MSKPKVELTRIPLDAQGYDANGAYYGTGAPVFLVTFPDGESQAIRAKSRTEAKTKAETLLVGRSMSNSGDDKPRRETKAATHKRALKERRTTYTTSWLHPLTQQRHALTIKHTRDYLSQGQDHIEIESAKKGTPHPVSETGYRSEFVRGTELINAGGPVTFVDALIAKAMRDKTWLAKETARAQGDLFQWADTQAETTQKARRSKRPAAKPGATARRQSTPE